jgi:sugar lactone lactonase YvrE
VLRSTAAICIRSRGGRIQKVDPAAGEVVAVLSATANLDYSGLTWAEGALWVAELRGRRIHKLDPGTGEILRTVRSDRLVTGITFADGELWHGSMDGEAPESGPSALHRIDPQSGAVLESLDMPEGDTISGLEYDGQGRFYAGGGSAGRLRVIRRPKR